MKIFFENADKLFTGKFKRLLRITLNIAKQTSKNISVNVKFVTKAEMQQINNSFRKINKATDVLSFPLLEVKKNFKINKKNFPFDFNKETKSILLGDIILCKEIIDLQAPMYHSNVVNEYYYLFVHGVLHLLGFDHMEEKDKLEMRELEKTIMKKVGITEK